jgi:hypothetical protein
MKLGFYWRIKMKIKELIDYLNNLSDEQKEMEVFIFSDEFGQYYELTKYNIEERKYTKKNKKYFVID